jgi:hypothetical protein
VLLTVAEVARSAAALASLASLDCVHALISHWKRCCQTLLGAVAAECDGVNNYTPHSMPHYLMCSEPAMCLCLVMSVQHQMCPSS